MKILKILGIAVLLIIAAGGILLYKNDIPADVVDAQYSSAASKFMAAASGARVHYRDEGKPDGIPIVLIHGSNASLHTWEPWVNQLGAEYRIISMDLPGHGLTGRTPDDDYTSDAFIKVVDEVVNLLKVDRFILGGNSMGGGVTWRYALAYPEKVQAMLLIDASGLPEWWQEQQVEQANSTEDETNKKEAPLAFKLLSQGWFRTLARHLDPYRLTAQGVRSAYNNSPVVNDALIQRYYNISLREGTRDATMIRFASFDPTASIEKIDLSPLTQPTLIMWGKEDSLISVTMAYQFDKALTDSTLVIYDNIGHIPMEELPEQSAKDVHNFIRANSLKINYKAAKSANPVKKVSVQVDAIM